MNILLLLMVIFKSKLLQYSFISEYTNIFVGLQGIKPDSGGYHQRTSKYIISSIILDLLWDLGQAGPSPGFFPDF